MKGSLWLKVSNEDGILFVRGQRGQPGGGPLSNLQGFLPEQANLSGSLLVARNVLYVGVRDGNSREKRFKDRRMQ